MSIAHVLIYFSKFLILNHLKFQKKTNQVAVTLYDSSMVAVNMLWQHKDQILQNKNQVIERLNSVLSTPETYDIVVRGKSSAKDILNRIDILKSVLKPD